MRQRRGRWLLVVSGVIFVVAVVFSAQVRAAKATSLTDSGGRTLAVILLCGIGAVLGLVAAAAASSGGNKRFAHLLPALANFILMLWFIGVTLAP